METDCHSLSECAAFLHLWNRFRRISMIRAEGHDGISDIEQPHSRIVSFGR